MLDVELSWTGVPDLTAVSTAELAEHRLPDGGPFPPSYRRLVARFGFFRLFGLWLVYPPASPGVADGYQGRGAELTRRLRSTYAEGRAEGFDWMVEPDGSWELVDDLVVFGLSENGDALLWDTSARLPDGELGVWCSRGFDSLTRLGASLDDALPRLRELSAPFSERAPADVECLTPARLD